MRDGEPRLLGKVGGPVGVRLRLAAVAGVVAKHREPVVRRGEACAVVGTLPELEAGTHGLRRLGQVAGQVLLEREAEQQLGSGGRVVARLVSQRDLEERDSLAVGARTRGVLGGGTRVGERALLVDRAHRMVCQQRRFAVPAASRASSIRAWRWGSPAAGIVLATA